MFRVHSTYQAFAKLMREGRVLQLLSSLRIYQGLIQGSGVSGVGFTWGSPYTAVPTTPPPHAPATMAHTAAGESLARGSSTATRSCCGALVPEEDLRFLLDFRARLDTTASMASRAWSKEASRLPGGLSAISPGAPVPAATATRDARRPPFRLVVVEPRGIADEAFCDVLALEASER